MSGWHCYMLECADGTLYTGITNDPEKRLTAHNDGTASKYTRSRLPVKFVFTETHPDRAAASRREAQIKRLPRAGKIALVGRNGVLPGPEKEGNLKNHLNRKGAKNAK